MPAHQWAHRVDTDELNEQPTRLSKRAIVSTSSSPMNRPTLAGVSSVSDARQMTERENAVYDAYRQVMHPSLDASVFHT